MNIFILVAWVLVLKSSLHSQSSSKPDIIDPMNPYVIDPKEGDIENKLKDWPIDKIEEYAVSNNPLYLSAKQNINIARGNVITASLYRNPVFSYQSQFLPFGNTTTNTLLGPTSTGGPIEHAPSITQDIDVEGVISQRTKVAQKGLEASIHEFEDFDRLFRLRLRQNYWLYLYAQELVNFQQDFYDNYSDLVKSTAFRAEKGDISPLEYDRILLEKLRIEKDLRDAEILRSQVARDLRFLIGISPKNQILVLKGKLKYQSIQELGLQLKDFNIEDRPDLKKLYTQVIQSKLNIDLKKKEGSIVSFLNLGGELRQKGNESYAGIFASIPLKIFDRNQGEILKSEEEYKKAVFEYESKKKQIYAEIRYAIKELLAREELLQNYQKVNLLEKNREIQAKYRKAYLRGAANLVTFLEAERNYLTVLRNYYEQLYLYYNAIENFRAAIGKLGKIYE